MIATAAPSRPTVPSTGRGSAEPCEAGGGATMTVAICTRDRADSLLRCVRSVVAQSVPREMQRRAQFYLDFVEAEYSTGFHAPQEATRILGEALDYARQGQLALRDADFRVRIAPPSRD